MEQAEFVDLGIQIRDWILSSTDVVGHLVARIDLSLHELADGLRISAPSCPRDSLARMSPQSL
jgi:hypothetical protein